jgi:hypothetical protein
MVERLTNHVSAAFDQAVQRGREEVTEAAAREVRDFGTAEEERELIDEMNPRIQTFARSNPEAHQGWAEHRELNGRSTDSRARQYQMLSWYTRGIPHALLRQIRCVEQYYTMIARLEYRLHRAQHADGSRSDEPIDDAGLAGLTDDLLFGYERSDVGNNFGHYTSPAMSEGREEDLLAHINADFATRMTRLLHATSDEDFNILQQRLRLFVTEALPTFDRLAASVANLPADFQERVSHERSLLIRFRESPLSYEGPSGDASGAGDDSDGSSQYDSPLQSGIPAAARDNRVENGEDQGDSGSSEFETLSSGVDQSES